MIIKIKNYSKQIVSIILLIFIFLINLSIEYNKYLDFIDEEIYETKVERFLELEELIESFNS